MKNKVEDANLEHAAELRKVPKDKDKKNDPSASALAGTKSNGSPIIFSGCSPRAGRKKDRKEPKRLGMCRPFTLAEEDAFAKLFRQYWDYALKCLTPFPGLDRELVASRALLKALLCFDPVKGSFKTILFWMLFQERGNAFRRDSKRLKYEVALPEDFEAPDEGSCNERKRSELAEELNVLLKPLSAKDRALLIDRYINGLTYEEMSQNH